MKILMATMSMGYGGAETHVLELSRELSRRGHTVYVASSGGVYEEELTQSGVFHVYAPLSSRSFSDIMKSKKILSALIERERFDIVHAHARIPAFICGKLQKKYGFIFVTTAHFDFKVNAALKRMTNWGDFVFSVSDDIADSLVKKYNYPRECITSVKNGIDTEKFSPLSDGKKIREEYSLSDSRVLMYLGRLDDDSFLPAKLLIEATPRILSSFPNVKTVIVGRGKNAEFLSELAEGVNKKAGREVVILTGPTTRTDEFVSSCDVFVGPSRSAMEALATGKPTVVAGTFGMLGLFSEEIEREAVRTNFCCRDSALPTVERIASEVIRALNFTDKERVDFCEYGRNFIENNYSVKIMANVYENEYKLLLSKRKKRIAVCGYYGYGNVGDEAMLSSLVNSLSENNEIGKISVMSATPEDTALKYNVDSVNRFDYGAVKRLLSASDIMIFGGGNILQDKTSTHSLLYYTYVMKLAKSHACAVALTANGIGPIVKKKNIAKVSNALGFSDYISLRDAASVKFVRELLPEKEVFETSDLAFSAPCDTSSFVNDIKNRYFVVCPKKIKGFSPDILVDFCNNVYEKYGFVAVFYPMHESEDEKMCERLSLRVKNSLFVGNKDTDIKGLLGKSEFSVCMRLHGVIFSLMEKCPMIGVSDDGKMSSFMASLGVSECAFFPPEVSATDLFVSAENLIAGRADVRDSLSFEAAKHKARAKEELSRLNGFIETYLSP